MHTLNTSGDSFHVEACGGKAVWGQSTGQSTSGDLSGPCGGKSRRVGAKHCVVCVAGSMQGALCTTVQL